MARKAIIAKEKRRERAGLHAKTSREKLRSIISDPNAGYDERMAAVVKLNKKPRNQSLTRRQRRCVVCGRAHGVYRLFGLCRLCLRKYAMRGLVPGVEKSSW